MTLEVLTTGAVNSIQDRGRPGYFDAGVSRCGAMDSLALDAGNALLGNSPDASGLEIALFPFRLRFGTDAAFALTGADCPATLDAQPVPPWWARRAKAGQTLILPPPRSGSRAYLTFLGGIPVPPVLGSRATDQKGGFGGLAGKGLARGDVLPLSEQKLSATAFMPAGLGTSPRHLAALPCGPVCELRVIPAAEHEAFAPEARRLFTEAEWLVTPDANRMGYRLSGPELTLQRSLELMSHGIMPGTVQVPPNGQPIIQLSDANTCGGYPKIATVIEADLWRLAQAPVGARLRFVATERDAAVRALRDRADALASLRAMAILLAKRG